MFITALFPIAKRWDQSTDWWTDSENVLYAYDGILFNLKKRRQSCHTLHHEWTLRHHAKWNKAVTKKTNTAWLHFYDGSKTNRKQNVVLKGWRKRKWGAVIQWVGFQLCNTKEFQRLAAQQGAHSKSSCTAHLKMVKMVILCVLGHTYTEKKDIIPWSHLNKYPVDKKKKKRNYLFQKKIHLLIL